MYLSLVDDPCWADACSAKDPRTIHLLRYSLLSSLGNSLVLVLNALQDCPLLSVLPRVVRMVEELLGRCICQVSSRRPSERTPQAETRIKDFEDSLIRGESKHSQGPPLDVEFFVFCDIFRDVLIPWVANHFASAFPSQKRIDVVSTLLMAAVLRGVAHCFAHSTNDLRECAAEGLGPQVRRATTFARRKPLRCSRAFERR